MKYYEKFEISYELVIDEVEEKISYDWEIYDDWLDMYLPKEDYIDVVRLNGSKSRQDYKERIKRNRRAKAYQDWALIDALEEAGY